MNETKNSLDNNLPDRRDVVWSLGRKVLYFLLVLGLFSYGWRVTEIDLGELARDFHLVKPLIKSLLRPDLITQNKKTSVVETLFHLGGPPLESAPYINKNSNVSIHLSKLWGNPGDPLIVEGEGLEPHHEGQLYWINSIDQAYPLGNIRTDAQGHFHMEIRVPEMARGNWQTLRATLVWNIGGWHLSRTLILASEKMVETFFLALMATFFAAIIAVPLSFLGARNLMIGRPLGRSVYYLGRTFFNVLRSIEPLVLAILFAVWVGIGPFAGMLALGVHSIAALGKLFSEQIESIELGPVEAISSVGANPLQVVLYGVLPQVIPQFLAFIFYRLDINVRMSTIIGMVGGGGIGFLLQQWINLLQYRKAGTALLLIVVVVMSLDFLSAKIRDRVG
tara:strand:- start:859 stop:2034 length:1176 start_codon:yes stop_codon:yes gene_type:complete